MVGERIHNIQDIGYLFELNYQDEQLEADQYCIRMAYFYHLLW